MHAIFLLLTIGLAVIWSGFGLFFAHRLAATMADNSHWSNARKLLGLIVSLAFAALLLSKMWTGLRLGLP